MIPTSDGSRAAATRLVAFTLCLLGLILAVTSSVEATVNINRVVRTIILPQSDSPVKIENCSAVANDFVSNLVRPPSYLYTQIHTEVSFENTDPRTATAVRFAFEVDNPFNTAYGTLMGTSMGTYSTGVLIQPHRAGLLDILQSDATAWNGNVHGQNVATVICYVTAVRFADGSVWTVDLKAEVQRLKAKLSPSPSPSPSPSRAFEKLGRGIFRGIGGKR